MLGVGVETIGTDAGQAGMFDPPFPNHATMHGAGKFGLASLCNLDLLPADRRGGDRGAAEDRQRQRQPPPRPRHHAGMSGIEPLRYIHEAGAREIADEDRGKRTQVEAVCRRSASPC